MARRRRSHSRRRTLTTAAAVGAAVATSGLAASSRRWARATDPTGGDPLAMPEGTTTRITSFDGSDLAVTLAGPDGAPVVVLSHCWTGDQRVWGPVARRLVDAGLRVVLYDQRAHGSSSSGSAGYTLEALAGDLRAVLEHLDLHDVVVAGHSMGGMTIQALAAEHPEVLAERVKAIVLVATSARNESLGARGDRTAVKLIGSRAAERSLTHGRFGPVFVRNTVGRRPALAHLHAVRETFIATPAEARASFLAAMQAMNFEPALATIQVPVTVIAGTHDRLTPLSRSKILVDRLPNAVLEVRPGAGHMLPLEEPDHVAGSIVTAVERTGVIDLRAHPVEPATA